MGFFNYIEEQEFNIRDINVGDMILLPITIVFIIPIIIPYTVIHCFDELLGTCSPFDYQPFKRKGNNG